MASDSTSVPQPGASSQHTVVKILATTREKELWSKFDLCEMSNGEQKARCKACGGFLKANSNTTLRSHIARYCKTLKGVPAQGQTTIGSDGGIWDFSTNMVRERMGKFVIQEGLPFDFFDNPRLTRLIQETLQPRYTHVSRNTLRRDCLGYWQQAKSDLINLFENLTTGVNLTSDIWSAPHNLPESYLCVTAHWIDPKSWLMMKRVIAFELCGYPHSGAKIYKILDIVIRTFKIENKIFSMSFDNASNNTTAVEKLRVKYKPICDGVFYHSRCVAHIINLVVQDGLHVEQVDDFKTSFKNMLRDIFKVSRKRYTNYRRLCHDTNSLCLGPNWDVPNRWNSTWGMFNSALRQRDTLHVFHNHLVERGRAIPYPVEGWECIKDVTEFLKVFKDATTFLSGVYYPTSPLVLNQLFLMANKLNEFQTKNEMFIAMVAPMLAKFKKYFAELPPVFTCAAAFNPCLNVPGVETLIDEITSDLGLAIDDPTFSQKTKDIFHKSLQNMFDVYLSKYGSTSNIHASSSGSGSGSSSSSRRNPMLNLYNTLRNENTKRQRGNTPSSELGRYSGTDFLSTMTPEEFESFDLLAWWKRKETEFPILSAMARDLLTVQASTVASESAFSFSGRVLSVRRTRLTPTALEMCICLKDHLDAAERIQDKTNLEDEISIEVVVHDEEVQSGTSPPVSDEELAYDLASRIGNYDSSD
ncbi:hypothetical protein QVD17_29191 [Tagetes erecta]|uniref:HAT C-terminal dimerisation domain-containing protein n=1 Tax=Tagetes erecta TaxID=13708 RepID=A0AAD8KBG7_TARER|nr:hypothetical protein QVD17_29191 [Tagetes erecta]